MYFPYVYIVTSRISGKFYIGMRSANKVVAEQDLGIKYFTSSKYVRNNFHEFDTKIIAYFADQLSAFQFENELIKEHWDDPLLLNKHYQRTMSDFSMTGAKRKDLSEYNKITKSKPKEDRIYTCEICQKIFTKLEFCHHPKKDNFVCGQKCNGIRNGSKSKSNKTREKIRESRLGKSSWNKGKSNTGFGLTNPMQDSSKKEKIIETRKKNNSKTGFASSNITNPMKDPIKIAKMLETRRINKEKKRGIG